jgi:hypothetical protein
MSRVNLDEDSYQQKYGIIQFKLPHHPFVTDGTKEAATVGKSFVIKLLEAMYGLGYDFITGSDLTRTTDQVSRLDFRIRVNLVFLENGLCHLLTRQIFDF